MSSGRKTGRDLFVHASPALLAEAAAGLFVSTALEAIALRGTFTVALAGGRTFGDAYRLLSKEPRRAEVRWESVLVFFGDERCVPEGDPKRNDRAAREALLDHVPIPAGNVHVIDAARTGAEARYESEIRAAFATPVGVVPRFDLVLLGVGEDGHTASLFPKHDALKVKERLVVRIAGSPKPPPERITLTLPLLNAARLVLFLATGTDKRDAVSRALAGDSAVPAGLVQPGDGRLVWMVDAAAAGTLP